MASCSGPVTTTMRSGETLSAASMTYESMGRPHTWCSTLGTSDFMRVPRPAARMTTASGGRLVSAVLMWFTLRMTPGVPPAGSGVS